MSQISKRLQKALEANNFAVYRAEDGDEARQRVVEEILPAVRPQSISWGGSLTFVSIGLYEALKKREDIEILDTFDKSLPPEQMLERRRRALLTDRNRYQRRHRIGPADQPGYDRQSGGRHHLRSPARIDPGRQK